MHQEPVEIPEQNEGDSAAFELKLNLTDSNEIARYIEKFSQLPTDQIMDIYDEAGMFGGIEAIAGRRKTELDLNLPDRVLSDEEISVE